MPKDIKMSDHLRELIERTKDHVMSPEERHAQMVSFVWGNMPHENNATKHQIEEGLRRREEA